MPLDCILNADGCIQCPFIPFVPATPPHVESTGLPGWNGGANSVVALDGDLHAVWDIPSGTVSAAVGFRISRWNNVEPTLIANAFVFSNVAGIDVYSIAEYGVTKFGPTTRDDPDADIEIRREGGIVTYRVGDDIVYTSLVPSFGVVLVNGCLYVSGDMVV